MQVAVSSNEIRPKGIELPLNVYIFKHLYIRKAITGATWSTIHIRSSSLQLYCVCRVRFQLQTFSHKHPHPRTPTSTLWSYFSRHSLIVIVQGHMTSHPPYTHSHTHGYCKIFLKRKSVAHFLGTPIFDTSLVRVNECFRFSTCMKRKKNNDDD